MTETPGVVSVPSAHPMAVLAGRLEAAISGRGLTLFARVDHGEGAREVGMALRPTVLFIFGAARGGTPLMQIDQIVGLDLPLKILLWQDESGAAHLGYADPVWIAGLRRLGPEGAAVAARLRAMLDALAHEVAA